MLAEPRPGLKIEAVVSPVISTAERDGCRSLVALVLSIFGVAMVSPRNERLGLAVRVSGRPLKDGVAPPERHQSAAGHGVQRSAPKDWFRCFVEHETLLEYCPE